MFSREVTYTVFLSKCFVGRKKTYLVLLKTCWQGQQHHLWGSEQNENVRLLVQKSIRISDGDFRAVNQVQGLSERGAPVRLHRLHAYEACPAFFERRGSLSGGEGVWERISNDK